MVGGRLPRPLPHPLPLLHRPLRRRCHRPPRRFRLPRSLRPRKPLRHLLRPPPPPPPAPATTPSASGSTKPTSPPTPTSVSSSSPSSPSSPASTSLASSPPPPPPPSPGSNPCSSPSTTPRPGLARGSPCWFPCPTSPTPLSTTPLPLRNLRRRSGFSHHRSSHRSASNPPSAPALSRSRLTASTRQISLMPATSKLDLCEFASAWTGQGKLSVCEEKCGIGSGSRIPFPWELMQPVLRILGHCLLAPLNHREVRDAASAAVRCMYARALHDLMPQAILAARSLIQLDRKARSASAIILANVSSNPNTLSKQRKPDVLLASK
ncbi:hypothetical protein QJS04_geneDACA014443 [Acorus gramineus]|uniref:Uncharacterized protein n=1 Tax=Acorus gramineus TaxID=55184 RepID=A0AAV9BPT5_ACOGR|nr:hypothetical protein QJS04_geneDACA014443 [Acorus gramineus]